jgi:Flp pilus assembly protein TadB
MRMLSFLRFICIATATLRAPWSSIHNVGMEYAESQKGDHGMLWTLFVILLIAWLVGLIGFHVVAWYIHLLLILALVVLVIQLISGRRPVV